jgi:hypothetical protein
VLSPMAIDEPNTNQYVDMLAALDYEESCFYQHEDNVVDHRKKPNYPSRFTRALRFCWRL